VLTPGTRLGPYEILSPLGAGGMGEVYRARDARLERDVAVKVLPPRLARDGEARSRFEREARAVAALSHPNILAIHDFGFEQGVAYAVTELLEGETLRERLDRGRVPVDRAVEYGLQIAAALGAAHEKGIVHRDVKPDNVFVTREGHIKVFDFGIAKRSEEPLVGGASTTADTAPGTVLGTVGYMSPEQVRSLPVDTRTDLFSLGCVLYEMIAGTRAFGRPTPADTLAAILTADPVPIDPAATGCPPELARLVARCLEKQREARFQSARDLAFALEASLRTARPAPRRISRAGRRRIDSVAILPFANGGGESELDYLVDGLTEDLIQSLARLSPARVIARSSVFRYKGIAADPRAVGRDLEVAAVVTGRATIRGSEIDVAAEIVDVADGAQIWGERYRRPLSALLALEEEIGSALAGRLEGRRRRPPAPPRVAASPEAYDLYLQGRFQWNRRTEEGFEKALALFEKAIRIDPAFALAYAGISDAYTFLGGYGHRAPEVAFPRAREAAEKALSFGSFADAHNSLASVLHRYAWDFPRAEAEFRRALAENPAHATAHHWFGLFLLTMGRFEEARAEVERASVLDPLSLVVREDRGYWLLCHREDAAAENEFRKVLEMDAAFAPARFDLGIALARRSLFPEAEAEIRRAIATAGERPRPLATLAWVLAAAGRRTDALALLDGLAGAPAFSRALVRVALEQPDEAFAELERAFGRREDALVSLLVNPRVDPLRGDPRFDELLKRVGLPRRAGD
jgi:serine/threonine protein kinase/tetratricopeptide (TPR) repeat protein